MVYQYELGPYLLQNDLLAVPAGPGRSVAYTLGMSDAPKVTTGMLLQALFTNPKQLMPLMFRWVARGWKHVVAMLLTFAAAGDHRQSAHPLDGLALSRSGCTPSHACGRVLVLLRLCACVALVCGEAATCCVYVCADVRMSAVCWCTGPSSRVGRCIRSTWA